MRSRLTIPTAGWQKVTLSQATELADLIGAYGGGSSGSEGSSSSSSEGSSSSEEGGEGGDEGGVEVFSDFWVYSGFPDLTASQVSQWIVHDALQLLFAISVARLQPSPKLLRALVRQELRVAPSA